MNQASLDSNTLAKRIVVVGTTGSGKTVLAHRLSQLLSLPHVELDALFWGPNWTPATAEVFRQQVIDAVKENAWVVDGNYSAVRDLVWPAANTLVWLDYSFTRTLFQLVRRELRLIITRKELWSGNRVGFHNAFFSRDSLFIWLLRSYWRRRRQFPLVLQSLEYAHLNVVRLRSPNETQRWLAGLGLPSLT